MDELATYIKNPSLVRSIAQKIRECKHLENDLCCECGRPHFFCGKYTWGICGICNTDRGYHNRGFEICYSKFEECKTCGHLEKSHGRTGIVNLDSEDLDYWEEYLQDLAKQKEHLTFEISYLDERVKELLEKHGIPIELVKIKRDDPSY